MSRVVYQQLGGHAPALQTGSNGPHHTTMRGHGHDAAPYLRPTRDAGTPVTQRTQNLRGPDEDTSLCRVCTRGQGIVKLMQNRSQTPSPRGKLRGWE